MLVIVHGWSDSADSFDRIAKNLGAALNVPVANIDLADYVSLDDAVTFGDLREAMQAAWLAHQLPTDPRSVDVLVHSTGALVVRDWMLHNFAPAGNPIKRLVMLAPANFGSPLATMGRSFIGRVVKGFNSDKPFQTGAHILRGLELASPYAWDLALRDRFDPNAVWYGPGRILCSVLVGTEGYSGIRALANSPGSDGTVRVSTANLNPVRVIADFSQDPQNPPQPKLIDAVGKTAFLRIPGENHGSIAQGGSAQTFQHIVDAFKVDDAGFDAYRKTLDGLSANNRQAESGERYKHGFQNTAIHLTDNLGQRVDDYVIEAYVPQGATIDTPDDVDDLLTKKVQETVLIDGHAYQDDTSYRALLFDCNTLDALLTAQGRNIEISVTAHPQISANSAGYRTFGFHDIGGILLTPQQQAELFSPDRTVLVDMIIRREQDSGLFKLRAPK